VTDPGDRVQDALDRAYRHLAHRDRTEREIRSHLDRAGVDGATIEEAVRVLTELTYLDDARFAIRFAQDRRTLDQWGAGRISRRLAALGIDPDRIDAALAVGMPHAGGETTVGDALTAESELDRAMALLRLRFPVPPEDRRGRDRALGVLLRKGYEPDLALEALAAYAGVGSHTETES
jgi:regulatory protein